MKTLSIILITFLLLSCAGNNIRVEYKTCSKNIVDGGYGPFMIDCINSGEPFLTVDNTLIIHGCGQIRNVCHVTYFPIPIK